MFSILIGQNENNGHFKLKIMRDKKIIVIHVLIHYLTMNNVKTNHRQNKNEIKFKSEGFYVGLLFKPFHSFFKLLHVTFISYLRFES